MPHSGQPVEANYAFASDNTAGICPEAWAALEKARTGYAPGYGDDDWTTRAADLLRDIFETDCDVYFCFTGTAANSMAISHLCRSYHSVIAHKYAHIETDECGGPEFFTHGTKVLLAPGSDGKIEPGEVDRIVKERDDIHYPKPRVLSLTQATELGTIYTETELGAISEAARRHGLSVHMDGARFANAVQGLGVSPKQITWQAGVDVLCFGGTKNGMPVGEAVIFFDRDVAAEFDYRCKQAGQLASKMRYLAAPWVGMLEDGAWLRHAAHANAMARRLGEAVTGIDGLELVRPVQANAAFVRMPKAWHKALEQRGWHAYGFIGDGGVRLMCSWSTREEDVEALVGDLREIATEARRHAPGSGT